MTYFDQVNFSGTSFKLVDRLSLYMPLTIVELTKVIRELTSPHSKDLSRTMVEAHRLTLQLLVDTGCLPGQKKGHVASAMHGPNPVLWEFVKGFEIDTVRLPSIHYFDSVQNAFRKLGLSVDMKHIKQNLMTMSPVDFSDTETMKVSLGIRGYLGTKFYFFKHPYAFFDSNFKTAMTHFLEQIPPDDATIVVMEDQELLERYDDEVLHAFGYRDVLPDLIRPAALDNLRKNEHVVVDLHAGLCLRFGGALRVYRKQIS
jgi:hypothetical protein